MGSLQTPLKYTTTINTTKIYNSCYHSKYVTIITTLRYGMIVFTVTKIYDRCYHHTAYIITIVSKCVLLSLLPLKYTTNTQINYQL